MAEKLLVKDDVVQSFVNDCHRGISMLSSSSAFTDRMADAAGPNGGLKKALAGVEDQWWIRRGKLLDAFEKLMETIAELRKKYKDLDEDLARSLARRDDSGGGGNGSGGQPESGQAVQPGGATPPAQPPGGQPQPTTQAGSPAAAAPIAPLGGGGNDGAWQPEPRQETPSVPPVQVAPLGTPLPDAGAPTGGAPSAPLQSILAFANRWAVLTGRTPEEVVALLVAGMGVAGLIPAAVLAQLGAKGGATNTRDSASAPTDAQDGRQGDGPNLGEAQQAPVPSPGQDAERVEDAATVGPAAESSPESLSAVADTDATPEPGTDPDGQVSTSPVAGPGSPDDLSAANPELSVGAAAEVPEDAAAGLQPELAAEAAATPLELPDLAPAPDGVTGAGGGGASPVSAGIELPPLVPGDGGAPASGGVAAAVELPDLAMPAPSAPGFSSIAPAAMPDLSTGVPVEAGVGAAAMSAPGMLRGGGLGSIGGGGMTMNGAPASTTSPTASGGVERDARFEAAQDVMQANEEEHR